MGIFLGILATLALMASWGAIRINKLFGEDDSVPIMMAAIAPYVFVGMVILDYLYAAVCSEEKLIKLKNLFEGEEQDD